MAQNNKISVNDAATQQALESAVGKGITVHGVLTWGDPINKLDGQALADEIATQKKNGRPMNCIPKGPYYKVVIKEAKVNLVDKDMAEKLVYQQIAPDKNGVMWLTVEAKNDLRLGYRSGDKIISIKRDAVAGKKFAYEQGVTITFEVYKSKTQGKIYVGPANIIFDEKPKFYEAQNRLGVVAGQDWSDEVDDFGFEASAPEAPVSETAAPAVPAEAPAAGGDDEWGSVWN